MFLDLEILSYLCSVEKGQTPSNSPIRGRTTTQVNSTNLTRVTSRQNRETDPTTHEKTTLKLCLTRESKKLKKLKKLKTIP